MAKNNLKAFVRYDANKRIIPGSTIFRKKKPNGNFIETNADLCCPTVSCLIPVELTISEVTACPGRTQTLTLVNPPAYDSIIWYYAENSGQVTITSGQGSSTIEVSFGDEAYDIEFFVALFKDGASGPFAYQTAYLSGLDCAPIP
jgi:hypothetical protein